MERFALNNNRISIFIGSSSESSSIAHALKFFFDPAIFNVDVWDEDVFERGNSNLDNLKKFTAIYDYSIMLFVQDDEIIHRGKKYDNVPPNIIFEYGLFLGRMGSDRSFIVAEKTKDIDDFIDQVFSDLKGISLGHFFKRVPDGGSDKVEGLERIAKSIEADIKAHYSGRADIGFLPSAALAIGYFENFMARVLSTLYDIRNTEDAQLQFKIFSRTSPEEVIRVPFYRNSYQLRVVLPPFLLDAGHETLNEKIVDYGMKRISISTKTRPFPVYWRSQSPEEIEKDGFIFYDFPTTLLSSQKVIEIMLRTSGRMSKEDIQLEELVGEREIHNFTKALEIKTLASEKTYLRKAIEIITDPDSYFESLS